jgi:DNA-3-methyladenine glycosylase II
VQYAPDQNKCSNTSSHYLQKAPLACEDLWKLSHPRGNISAMRASETAMRAAEIHTTTLAATTPFALRASLRAMNSFSPCAGDQYVAVDHVRKAFVRPGADDRAVVVEVGERPDARPGVLLRVFADAPLSAGEAAGVETSVRQWLGLDDQMEDFLALGAADRGFAPILAVVHGLHQVRFASFAEAVVYFTMTQRSTQWFAAARKRRLAAQVGPRAIVDGVTYTAFPTLARLAELDTVAWLEHAGSASRAARLVEVVRGIAALDMALLREGPFARARAALLATPGVGPFTAHALLLRALGRPDDVPLEMDQFIRAAAIIYGAAPPTPAQLRARYPGYVGWWSYFARMGLAWREAPAAREAAGLAAAA